MASAVPTASSTKETTNYARLCRLLVDIGTQALRDTLDAIHPPANLHAVLAGNSGTLKTLAKRRIINPIQRGKLFPAIPTSVSSRNFDTTLLMVLLRNLCGLTPPLTGWDAFPALTDLSREADIVRVKYFRNTVYGHAETASVDEATFNDHWRDIRDPLVRLGGVTYIAAIDDLRNECMDPEVQDHCKDLLSQWKKDDDNVKEQVDEIKKRLDVLTATADEEKVQELAMCKESYHENEALEYYCQQCKLCICLKCGQTRHNHHEKVDIQQAAEQVLVKAKAEVVVVEGKINKQIELRNKSKARIVAAHDKLSETVKGLTETVEVGSIQVVSDHETAMKNKLIEIDEAQERDHVAQLEKFQLLLTELYSSIERGDDMFQRGIGIEVRQEEYDVFRGCEELLNQSQKMQVYTPDHVNYVVNKGTVSAAGRLLPLGQVVASGTDHSQSVVEGKGLKQAQMGANTKFTITTRDSEGKQFHDERDKVTVTVSSSTGDEEVQIRDCKDGKYTVQYKPKSVGRHDVAIEINGWPLSGSPWSVNSATAPHRYRVALSFGSHGKRPGKFNRPVGIAKNERTGNIAVADSDNIQLFDKDFKYLRTIGGVTGLPTGAVKIGEPISVAFSRDGDIIVTHGNEARTSRKMSVITARGQFIEHFSEHVIGPHGVFVKTDGSGHVIVCEVHESEIKVLSPDGAELLQFFSAPRGNEKPCFVVYHHDMFFVSYYAVGCVKVFNKDGVFLYDIGSEGSGEQLSMPCGVAVDAFDNLIVCDYGNSRLKVFTLKGKFLTLIDEKITENPSFVTVCNNGDVLVSDDIEDCIHVLE